MIIVSTYVAFGSGFATHVNYYGGNANGFWDCYFGQLHAEWNIIP